MSKQWNESTATAKGLYDPRYEHDNCGIGAVVNIKGIKTHETVENALKIVENLKHRAGKDADGKTGDGVGILLQISHKFFKKVTKPLGIELGDERDYGVGMFFFPNDEFKTIQAKKMLEVIVEKEGLEFLGWREVPTEPDKLSKKARDCMPCIMQCFVKRPEDVERGLEFDRKLYVARRVFEQSNDNTYVVSFSSRTIVYKGMFLVEQLRQFFMDLQDPDYESAIATVHSRFSTNTNPSWERSHPNRFIVHNGEINTILGNSDKMSAREENMESPKLKKEFQKVLPVINAAGSDSAMLDNALEFLVMSGMELPLAVMIMIPEPWANNNIMSQKKKDFYQYYATMMEPWDGPASILFSDGDMMGAVLDRNGLRPSRYYITDDDYLILSSEVGVLDIDPARIVKKSRLEPGKMLLVDTVSGRLIDDDELKEQYATEELQRVVQTGGVGACRIDNRIDLVEILFAHDVGFHRLLAGEHAVCVAANRVDFAVVQDEAVRMCALPGRVGVGGKTGMYHRNGGLVILIQQVAVEVAQLADQKHALIYNGAAGERNNIGVVVGLLKDAARHVQLAVKIQTLIYVLRAGNEALLDVRHTGECLVAQNVRSDGHGAPADTSAQSSISRAEKRTRRWTMHCLL